MPNLTLILTKYPEPEEKILDGMTPPKIGTFTPQAAYRSPASKPPLIPNRGHATLFKVDSFRTGTFGSVGCIK